MVEVWWLFELVDATIAIVIERSRMFVFNVLRRILTMDHLLNRLLIVLTQVDDTSVGFFHLRTACAVEEAAPRAHDCSMDSPLSVVAYDCQIGVFPTQVKPAPIMSAGVLVHFPYIYAYLGLTYVESAFINSICGEDSMAIVSRSRFGEPVLQVRADARRAGG